jgi:hypothetical protein
MHAYKYFVEFATLAQEASYNTMCNWRHVHLLLKQNMNQILINKLYALCQLHMMTIYPSFIVLMPNSRCDNIAILIYLFGKLRTNPLVLKVS